ncbi:Cyclin-dependent kinase 1 [Pseudozyma hubeiensis]|nr:Cyclin-dependent kinase 1 [Pseudozyma hubeiensis]
MAALRQRLAARSEGALGQDEVGGSQGRKRKARGNDPDAEEGEDLSGAGGNEARSESRSAQAPASPAQSTTPEPYRRAPTWSALRRSNHPPIAPSRSIYSYERLNHIQEGTYGVVFRARPREPLSPPGPSSVAVKKLKLPSTALHSGFPITSLREISTLSSSRGHPNIVTLHEVCIGNTIDQIFLILEFMEHDLKTLLTSMSRSPGTGFAPSEIKTLMFQLCEALAGLHDAWVTHRDLKSSNLLMDNRGRLKVGDFGLARRFGDPIDGWRGAGERSEAVEGKKEREEVGEGGMTDLRISAKAALKHEYFTREKPTMAHPDSFGSFPSSAAGEKQVDTPSAPDRRGLRAGRKASAAEVRGGKQYKMEFDFTG